MSLKSLIDVTNYPMIGSQELTEQLNFYHRQLGERGLTVLPDFLAKDALKEALDYATSHKADFFKRTVYGNAYLCDKDPSLGPQHVLNRIDATTIGTLASDQIPQDSPLKRLYHCDEFLEIVRVLTGKPKVYRYECPLGDVNVALMEHGDYLRWHFDQSDFVVSIPLQHPESGGQYEYIRNLRSKTDPNYSGVESALNGENEEVQLLEAKPGSLVLFEGRYTLHRVTQINGLKDRYVALFGFADRAGVTSSDYLRKIRYGRVS